MDPAESYPFETLPDYLSPGPRLLLIAINPSVVLFEQGRLVRPSRRLS
jgi:hypothetical protein